MAFSRRYENETADTIHQRMLDEIDDRVDKRQGSVTHDMTRPAALEIEQAYIEADKLLTFGFASDNMPSEYLDLRAAEVGLSRLPSVKATGFVTIFGDEGREITEGTRVSTGGEKPLYFEIIEAGTIIDGEVTLKAIAEEGGTSGNVGAGEITNVVGNLTGITGVTNAEAFEGGVNVESDESLLERYFYKVQKPAASGNIYHYEQWAREVPGVGAVRVIPLWDGNGTVKVVIIDSDMQSPSQTIIDEVYEHIEEERPIGATVTVVGADKLPVDVSATLLLTGDAGINEVTMKVTEEVERYLATIAFKSATVRYTKIAAILLSIPQIVDYFDLTINGGTDNITVGDEQVASVGGVLLSA